MGYALVKVLKGGGGRRDQISLEDGRTRDLSSLVEEQELAAGTIAS